MRNKIVCFVGGCSNIIGLGKGPEIDKYDIVIRSNGGYPVQDRLKGDYGSKCDIWSINNQYSRYMRRHGMQPQKVTPIYKNDLKAIFSRLSSIPGLLMGPAVWTWVLEQNPKELYITGIDFMN
jgi:hypothetical protein